LTEAASRRRGDDWLAQWFELEPTARLIVNRDLSVLAVNLRAARMLEDNWLALRDGSLSIRDRRIELDLAAAVAAAGVQAKSFVLGADAATAMLVEAVALGEPPHGPVGLVLRDLHAPVEVECADLEPIFGVTPGEHQVIVRLLQGYSSRDIADQFGKSILTIRTHVKRAYGKIGVKTRGQLFARLLPYLTIR
jgi:DNA-binding CsgD family transcriptional regulator